ncbi:MAG: TonB-dependent receptor, partial [Bacteroidota bacterium]
ESEAHFYEPIISLNYLPHPSWQLKLNYGIYRQFLRTLRDIDLNPSNAQGTIWVLGTEGAIPPVRNRQTTLGLVYNQKGWLLDLELYYKRIDGLISSNYSRGGDNQRLDFTPGEGNIWGLDILLKKRWKWYRNWLSYSFAQADNTFPGLQVELGLTSSTFPSFLDIRHQFQWIQTVELGAFEFSLAWTFRSSLPITEPIGTREITEFVEDENGDPTNVIAEQFFALEWGEINARRLPNYHRLDFSIWYRFPNNPEAAWQGKLGLAWLNIYNRQNIQNRAFYVDDPEGNVVIQSEEQLFIRSTPNISLEFRF